MNSTVIIFSLQTPYSSHQTIKEKKSFFNYICHATGIKLTINQILPLRSYFYGSMYNIPNMYLLWVDRQSRHIRKLPWGLPGGFLEEEIPI